MCAVNGIYKNLSWRMCVYKIPKINAVGLGEGFGGRGVQHCPDRLPVFRPETRGKSAAVWLGPWGRGGSTAERRLRRNLGMVFIFRIGLATIIFFLKIQIHTCRTG